MKKFKLNKDGIMASTLDPKKEKLKRYWVMHPTVAGVISIHDTKEEASVAAQLVGSDAYIQDFNSLSPDTFS